MSSPKDEEIKLLAKQVFVHRMLSHQDAWDLAVAASTFFDQKVRELIAAREAAAAEKKRRP